MIDHFFPRRACLLLLWCFQRHQTDRFVIVVLRRIVKYCFGVMQLLPVLQLGVGNDSRIGPDYVFLLGRLIMPLPKRGGRTTASGIRQGLSAQQVFIACVI